MKIFGLYQRCVIGWLGRALLGNPCWPCSGNQAYQFLLIGLALVLTLQLCHLKSHCHLADGITPLTPSQNQQTRAGDQGHFLIPIPPVFASHRMLP